MIRARSLLLAALVAGASCGPSGRGALPVPPVVTLTAPAAELEGRELTLTLQVTGCDEVRSAQLLESDVPLQALTLTERTTTLVLSTADLAPRFRALGIAAELTLVAEVTCSDDRSNRSAPVAVRFFPVERVLSLPAGQALPDSFFAEGGVAGAPVSFGGCVGASGATALARVRLDGVVTALNDALPFTCSSRAEYSRPVTGGQRWLWEPGVGVLSFDATLSTSSAVRGEISVFTVAPDGDALIIDTEGGARMARVQPGVPAASALRWTASVGRTIGPPQVAAGGEVLVPHFQDELGQYHGFVRLHRYADDTGNFLGAVELKRIDYSLGVAPLVPSVFLNPAGTVAYFAYQPGPGFDPSRSVLYACDATAPGCSGAANLWKSAELKGAVLLVQPFDGGGKLAVVTETQVHFLDAATGARLNLGNVPLAATGGLVAFGALPGPGSAFYALFGPPGGFASEVVATDAPIAGELWRHRISGAGAAAPGALALALDDAGRAWLRVAGRQVQPLELTEYRALRGPTVTP